MTKPPSVTSSKSLHRLKHAVVVGEKILMKQKNPVKSKQAGSYTKFNQDVADKQPSVAWTHRQF